MILQPEDFWSFYEWLMRPDAFLQSALLKGIVLILLAIVLGLIVGYVYSASRYGPVEGFYAVARAIRDLIRFDLPGTSTASRVRTGPFGVQGSDSPQGAVCRRTVSRRAVAGRLVPESRER